MRSDLFVVSPPPTAAGERFTVIRPDTILSLLSSRGEAPPPLPPQTDGRSAWEHALNWFLRDAEWLTEESVRIELSEIGLDPGEVDQQLRRARALRDFNQQLTWDHVTRIGFRNTHRQEVIRKTELAGSAERQRVYILRCGDCDHEHTSDGSEIHLSRCPQCQDE